MADRQVHSDISGSTGASSTPPGGLDISDLQLQQYLEKHRASLLHEAEACKDKLETIARSLFERHGVNVWAHLQQSLDEIVGRAVTTEMTLEGIVREVQILGYGFSKKASTVTNDVSSTLKKLVDQGTLTRAERGRYSPNPQTGVSEGGAA